MRLIVVLAITFIGAVPLASATEPEPPATASTTMPSSPPTEPTAPAAAPSSTSAPGKTPVVIRADKPELTHDEKLLVSSGYKLEMRNGEKWFCRREQMLGSRVNEVRHCGTASMLLQTRQRQREETSNQQRVRPPDITK